MKLSDLLFSEIDIKLHSYVLGIDDNISIDDLKAKVEACLLKDRMLLLNEACLLAKSCFDNGVMLLQDDIILANHIQEWHQDILIVAVYGRLITKKLNGSSSLWFQEIYAQFDKYLKTGLQLLHFVITHYAFIEENVRWQAFEVDVLKYPYFDSEQYKII